MRKKLFYLIILLSLIISISSLFAANSVVIRFEDPNSQIISTFIDGNYDIAAFKPGEFLDIVVSEIDYQKILQQGYDVIITQTEEQMKNNLNDPTELNGYRDYEEMLTELQQLEADNPAICKLFDIGETRINSFES